MATEIITLKQLCIELKLNPYGARKSLRAAASDPKKYPELAKIHKPRKPWRWLKGSDIEKEILTILNFNHSAIMK